MSAIRSVLTTKLNKVEGIDEMLAKLRALKVVPRNAKETFVRAAMVIRDEARDLVPRKSGRLHDAIFAGAGDPKKPDALVGVNQDWRRGGAPHAHFIEYGTSKRPAHPFMRPALRAARPTAARIIAEGLRSDIESALKGHYRPSGSYEAKPKPQMFPIGGEFA